MHKFQTNSDDHRSSETGGDPKLLSALSVCLNPSLHHFLKLHREDPSPADTGTTGGRDPQPQSPAAPFSMDTHLVEINLISAQGLKPPPGSRRFQTYAVGWVDPAAKLRTAVDRGGGENPTWNEKFVFRVPAALLSADSPSALSVEIYASGGWYLPDSLVGAVRLLLANLHLLNLPADSPAFAAVGVRRPSGRIHGILNVGAAVLSRVPIFITEALVGTPAVGYRDFIGDGARPQLRRAVSVKLISHPPSPASEDPALKDCNREVKRAEGDCDGGDSALCGLGFPRKIHASPSDQNLAIWGFHEKERR